MDEDVDDEDVDDDDVDEDVDDEDVDDDDVDEDEAEALLRVVAFLQAVSSSWLKLLSKQHSSLLNLMAISELMVDCFKVGR